MAGVVANGPWTGSRNSPKRNGAYEPKRLGMGAATVSLDEKRAQKKDGCVLCSLLDGVEGTVPGKTIGHFVEIPDSGRILLGEILAFYSIQLTMVRAELGCNVHGLVSASSSHINVSTMPPS